MAVQVQGWRSYLPHGRDTYTLGVHLKLRVFTLVFGSKFITLFERGRSRSLAWKNNNAALHGAVWDIYADPIERDRVLGIAQKVGLQVVFHDIPDIQGTPRKLLACLVDAAARCASTGSGLLTAQPDLIFGDGTIRTLVKIASEQSECCVALPHPRVNDAEFLADMPDSEIPNAALVSMAFRHLHKSWADSNLALENVNCFVSGSAWRELSEGMYGVSMRIPTTFLARPNADDVQILRQAGLGAWDHKWPEALVKQQRQRVIGSSDAAFVVELTPRSSHVCGVREKLPNQQDIYRYDLEHHRVNRNTIAVWRCG